MDPLTIDPLFPRLIALHQHDQRLAISEDANKRNINRRTPRFPLPYVQRPYCCPPFCRRGRVQQVAAAAPRRGYVAAAETADSGTNIAGRPALKVEEGTVKPVIVGALPRQRCGGRERGVEGPQIPKRGREGR